MSSLNALRWNGGPAHYEVWFVTLTDRASGVGVWVRYALHAPDGPGRPAEASLWFVAIAPDGARTARKATLPATGLAGTDAPFRLTVDGPADGAGARPPFAAGSPGVIAAQPSAGPSSETAARPSLAGPSGAAAHGELRDDGAQGAFEDVSWDLHWTPAAEPGLPVHPLLERARLAKTMYVIPQPAAEITGTVTFAGRTLALGGAHGAQAHLWGAKHASGWGWTHAADLETQAGDPAPGDWLDAISISTPRFGRQIAATSVTGRLLGEPFAATSPASVLRATSASGLTAYRGEAQAGSRRVRWDTAADRATLVGVTYEDPDGERLRCWNTEVATLRLTVWDRGQGRWRLKETLRAPRRACFEYAQRNPLHDLPMDLG